jgi:hypothetical protein
MGRSVFYPPPRSGTIQSVQSLMRINQPPRRRAEMHRVFLISVNVGYCRSSISRVCWAALRIASTTFLVAPPKCVGRCPAHLPSRNAGDAQASVGFFSLGTGGQTLVLQRSKSRCPQKSAVRSQSLMSRPCFLLHRTFSAPSHMSPATAAQVFAKRSPRKWISSSTVLEHQSRSCPPFRTEQPVELYRQGCRPRRVW